MKDGEEQEYSAIKNAKKYTYSQIKDLIMSTWVPDHRFNEATVKERLSKIFKKFGEKERFMDNIESLAQATQQLFTE